MFIEDSVGGHIHAKVMNLGDPAYTTQMFNKQLLEKNPWHLEGTSSRFLMRSGLSSTRVRGNRLMCKPDTTSCHLGGEGDWAVCGKAKLPKAIILKWC